MQHGFTAKKHSCDERLGSDQAMPLIVTRNLNYKTRKEKKTASPPCSLVYPGPVKILGYVEKDSKSSDNVTTEKKKTTTTKEKKVSSKLSSSTAEEIRALENKVFREVQ